MTGDKQGRSARTTRQPAPFLRPAILGDTVDHALTAEHGGGDLLLSGSCSSIDFDSSNLSECTEDVLKELKLVEAQMLAAAGRHIFKLAGELQSRVGVLKDGLMKRQAAGGAPSEEIALLSAHAHKKQCSITGTTTRTTPHGCNLAAPACAGISWV